MTSIFHAIVLGIVQGLAEFIPISSSGHLVLVPALFGLEPGGLAFGVALHLGTMGAVIVYMRRELWTIATAIIGINRSPDAVLYRKLGWFTLIASVPVGIAGLTLRASFERIFATPVIAAVMLLVTGAMLFAGEYLRDRRITRTPQPVTPDGAPVVPASATAVPADDGSLPRGRDHTDPSGLSLADMRLREAVLVGLGQCVALLPGISRSGTTIVAGMASGMTREAATRFSFLLSLPALAGATLVSLPDLTSGTNEYPGIAIVAGIIAAFASGYLAIRVLIALVARDRLTGFGVYCIAAGTAALIALQFV